jgi:hypothetical protein
LPSTSTIVEIWPFLRTRKRIGDQVPAPGYRFDQKDPDLARSGLKIKGQDHTLSSTKKNSNEYLKKYNPDQFFVKAKLI